MASQAGPNESHPFLSIRARAESGKPAIDVLWRAALVVGAYSDITSADRAASGFSVTLETTAGVKTSAGSYPRPLAPSAFAKMKRAVNTEKALDGLNARGRTFGLSVDRHAELHPLGTALAVVLEAHDVEAFNAQTGEAILALSQPLVSPDNPKLDGLYLEIRDLRGSLLHATGYASRLKIGAAWDHRSGVTP